MERFCKKSKQYNRNTPKLDRERVETVYPSFKIKFPICIGLAHVNRKGKISKTGLFTWISSNEKYQEYIKKINSQLEELRDNEYFFIEKEAKLNNELFKLENIELFPEQENHEDKETTVKRNKEMLEQELTKTREVIKTISKIDRETNNMWLITVETIGRKQKLKKIAKVENIILGGF